MTINEIKLMLVNTTCIKLIIDWSAVQVCEGPPYFERRSRLIPTTPFLYLISLGTVSVAVTRH